MQSETVPISSLTYDPANVRKHSRRNLDAIKASLARFGQQKPIVIDKDGCVRAGNGTLEAARELGWTDIGVIRSDLVGAEMTAFAIADNRTAELAEWDYDALRSTLAALKDGELGDEAIDATGFELGTVAAMLSEAQQDLSDLGDVDLGSSVELRPDQHVPRGDGEGGIIRTMLLPFSPEQYEQVSRYFVELRAETGAETNAEALLKKAAAWEEQA
jgi:ParB-like chromosome segregation protein Spo0J|tara:strand:+ start:122 stop:769 length:648 start_codon:yes stop_codon:yes gene_type:complete